MKQYITKNRGYSQTFRFQFYKATYEFYRILKDIEYYFFGQISDKLIPVYKTYTATLYLLHRLSPVFNRLPIDTSEMSSL